MTIITELLRRHEAVKKYAYLCPAGKTTIGVGRNVDANGGIGLSDDEIDYLLANDIKRVNNELKSAFTWYADLCAARKDAMLDICFNLGLPRLRKFKKALAAMAAKNYDLAAAEFLDSRWARQVGRRAITVTNMIRSGGYDASP